MSDSPLTTYPLVVDVDGTLLATDTLYESFWAGLGRAPLATLRAIWAGRRSRARLKAKLAEVARPEIGLLPCRAEVIALIEAAHTEGRSVILASGANQSLVDALAERLGLQGAHIGSDHSVNLTAQNKADALVARFGEQGFDYIGDSRADLPVWAAARHGFVVAPNARLRQALAKAGLSPTVVDAPASPRALLRAMRPHQWVKNVLLLLPVLAVHRFDLETLGAVFAGICAFSAAASSIYIVNDLLDLAADRQHSKKRFRPFAAGTASIRAGMMLGAGLGLLALGISAVLGWGMVGLIALYMALSLAYSLRLKRLRWVDIFMLATLYTLRVVAGSLAGGLELSGWLANFVFPVFLALGCVKRLTELADAPAGKPLAGRGYAPEDRGDLRNIALAALVGATAIFVMYSYSEIASTLYQYPWVLRLAALAVPIWLGRMIARGWQGRMDHDPIVFALRDARGLALLAMAMMLVLLAAGLI